MSLHVEREGGGGGGGEGQRLVSVEVDPDLEGGGVGADGDVGGGQAPQLAGDTGRAWRSTVGMHAVVALDYGLYL